MVDSGLELSAVDSQPTEKSVQFSDADSRSFVTPIATSSDRSWITSGARLKLQEKHARHLADVQTFYNEKLSELQRQLGVVCADDGVLTDVVTVLRRSRQQYEDLKIAHNTLQRQTAELEKSLAALQEQLAAASAEVDKAHADSLESATRLSGEQARATRLQVLLDEEKTLRQSTEERHRQELSVLSERLRFEEEQSVRLQQQLRQTEAETARVQAELQLVSSTKREESEELASLKSNYLQAVERSRLDQRLIARLLPQYEQVCDELEARKREDGVLRSHLEHCEHQLAATQADYQLERQDKEDLDRQVTDLERELLALRSWRNKVVNESSNVLAGVQYGGASSQHSFNGFGQRQLATLSREALPGGEDAGVMSREPMVFPSQHHQQRFLSSEEAADGDSSSLTATSPRSISSERSPERFVRVTEASKLPSQNRQTISRHLGQDFSANPRPQPYSGQLSSPQRAVANPPSKSTRASPFFRASGAGQRMVSVDNPLAQQMTGIRGAPLKRQSTGEVAFSHDRPATSAATQADFMPPVSDLHMGRREKNRPPPSNQSDDIPARSSRQLVHSGSFTEDCARLGLRPIDWSHSNQRSHLSAPALQPSSSVPESSHGNDSVLSHLHQSSRTALSALRSGALVAHGPAEKDSERDHDPTAQAGLSSLGQQSSISSPVGHQLTTTEERVQHRLALAEEAEKRVNALMLERDEVEAFLRRHPVQAKVVLADKQLSVEKERHLDELDREIASLRLSLRNLNVFRR